MPCPQSPHIDLTLWTPTQVLAWWGKGMSMNQKNGGLWWFMVPQTTTTNHPQTFLFPGCFMIYWVCECGDASVEEEKIKTLVSSLVICELGNSLNHGLEANKPAQFFSNDVLGLTLAENLPRLMIQH